MRTFFFDLLVRHDEAQEPEDWLDAVEDRLFEMFEGDVAPWVHAGTPKLACSVEAPSLTQAIRRTLHQLRTEGIEIVRVEAEPAAFLRPAA